MSEYQDLDRQLNAFLVDGPTTLPDASFDAVRDRTEQTRQRVVLGPWRAPHMNKLLTIGLGAAAVIAVVFLGSRFVGSPTATVGGPASEPPASAAPSAAPASVEPTTTPDDSLAEGPYLVFDPSAQSAPLDDGPPVTVTIPARGWTAIPEYGAITKGDQGDPPEGAGAALLTGDTGADGLYVYRDPCHWQSTTPINPATTVDEIVDALAAQASRDATAPVEVTVGGYAGKSITLHVPNTSSTRGDAFKDCDQDTFATYGVEGLDGPARYQQGPGQVDEFWILDVGGKLVILDATYNPPTPAELIDELRTIVQSATFE
jgi:hypothetical protein